MVKITKVSELTEPKFIQPVALEYIQNGVTKQWEAVRAHDSVAILLYHQSKQAFVIVKQLRAPVLYANKKDGYMHELCAGIIDKDIAHIQIAQEEILEECGYDVPLGAIQEVTSYYTSVGISGTQQTLYYAKIDESMKVNEGGGIEDEAIEVLYIPIDKAKEFLLDETYKKTPGMFMGFYWWFEQRDFNQIL